MMTKKTLAFITSFFIFFAFGAALVVAQEGGTGAGGPEGGTGTTQNVGITIPNPFRHGDTIPELFRAIVDNIILPIGGVLAVLAFIYSGFMYVTAQGNETKIATANRALLYTAIGTAVLLGAWVISSVIETTINQLRS